VDSASVRPKRIATGIPRLVVHPEGPASEWKVRLPSDDRIGPLLCAFANGVGGASRWALVMTGAALV
jgi:hypothetical protein